MTETSKRERRWTVRAFLLALVLACLLPGVLGASALLAWQYRQGRAQLATSTLQTSRAMVQAVDFHLQKVSAVAQSLSSSHALASGDLARFHAEASAVIKQVGLGTNVVLRDEAGRQLLNTAVPWGAPLVAPLAPEQVREVFASRRPVVSDIFIGPVIHRPIMSVDVPVFLGGAVRYALGIGVLPRHFTEVLQTQQVPPRWLVGIMDRAGTLAGRSRNADLYVGRKTSSAMLAQMQVRREGVVEVVTLDGQDMIVFFSRSQATGWSVAIGIPRKEVESVIVRTSSLMAAGVAALFALGALLAWIIGGHIARSFQALTEAAGELGLGGPVTARSLPIQEADDAIESLQKAGAILGERNQTLREADRRKDEFISILAHELRNPLAPVRTAVEILRRTREGDARQQRACEIIERQIRHMARLVDDLLDISRIARGRLSLHLERCDMARITCQTAEDYRPSVEAAGQALEVDVGHAPLWIQGDPVRVAQMVGNLLNNAVRFTGAGGRIQVRVGREGAMAQACVIDNGVGIAPELLARLFDPFSQADQDLARSKGGLGLGLALTRGLARLHGGQLNAHSDGLGQGARFTLSLPLAPPLPSPVPPGPAGTTLRTIRG